MPKDQALKDQLINVPFPWNTGLGAFSRNRLFTVVGTLRHLWWIMFLATAFSIIIGYIYIWGIKHCPYQLAKFFLMPGILFFAAMGICFLVSLTCICGRESSACSNYKEDNPFNPFYRMTYTDQTKDVLSITTGVVCLGISLGFFGMAWNFKSVGVNDLITASYECWRSVPGLYYVPAIEGFAKFVVFWTGMKGFAVIFSEGFVVKNRIYIDGARFAGLSRVFDASYTDVRFWLLMALWIFFFFWCLEFCVAMGQFITSYCAFKYYGVKKDKSKKKEILAGPTVANALKAGLIYHPGSVLRCAWIVPLYRPVRFINWFSSEITRQGSGSQNSSFAGMLCDFVCCCCLGFCGTCNKNTRDAMQKDTFPIKDALNDVVIRANDFDNACEKAHALLEHSHKVVQMMYRDINQATINLIGTFSSATAATMLVYLIVTNMSMYKEETSPMFVADPVLVCFLCWVLTSYVAFGFMTLWDHTADCLMYDYAWSRRWNRKIVDKYIPETLRCIVGNDDKEDDRYPYYGKAKTSMYLRSWIPMMGGLVDDPKKRKAQDHKVDPMMTGSAPPMMGVGQRPPSVGEPSGWVSSGWGSGFGGGGGGAREFSGPEDAPLLGPV
jgi:hypothetical protein